VAVNSVIGGFASAAFYGFDRTVGAVSEGIAGRRSNQQQEIAGSEGDSYSPTPNSGQGFSPKGYNPQPGERTFEGYVNNNVPRDVETKLFTHSSNFNTNPRSDGHFKRFGTKPNQHGIVGAYVHQPTRNFNPNNGMITGKPSSKTKNGGVTVPD